MSSGRSTPVALLDVNVLVALAWPNHQGHRAAHAWFRREVSPRWATTPVTECGFVRISSNRLVLPTPTTPGVAIEMLGALARVGRHEFWEDTITMVTGERIDLALLRGHRQVTDAHLVALCLARRGRLVTFDKGIADLVDDADDVVEVLQV